MAAIEPATEPDRRESYPSGVEDRELIALVAAGDDGAFRALFGRYAPTAVALAQRVLRDRALAEDAVQEAFLTVWRDADAYDPARLSVRSWVMVLVHRRSVDRVRREQAHRARARAVALDADAMDPIREVEESIDGDAERRALLAAIAALPDEQSEVLRRLYFEGATGQRVAEDLGIPLGTVKSRTRLAMTKLRSALAA